MSLINFSGLASGIDSNSLIDAILSQQRKAQVDPLKRQVTELEDTNTSYGELSSLLSKLQGAAGKFRVLNGSALSKTATSSNEAVSTALAGNAALNGTYSLSISQLATAATYSFADRFSDSSTVINGSINNGAAAADRTVTVTIGTGANQESVAVELTNTSTADDFVRSFNTASDSAEASLVNVGTSSSPSYAIVINSVNQGVDKGQIGVAVGSEVQTAGAGAFLTGSATLNQAQNSQFTLSGISGTISRSTNSVSDVIQGVTFNLQSTGTSTVSIKDDSETTTTTMEAFVDAYNDVVRYISEKDAITQEQNGPEIVNIFGPLAGSSVDENVLNSLRSSITASGKSGGTVNIFADLGITTERDGTLKFDRDKFSTALSSDPEGVRTITQNLGENLSAVDGTIAQYIRFNGIIGLAETSNSDRISTLNDRITNVESLLAKQKDTLTSQYARLEALIGKLNSQQNALSGILPR